MAQVNGDGNVFVQTRVQADAPDDLTGPAAIIGVNGRPTGLEELDPRQGDDAILTHVLLGSLDDWPWQG